MSDDGRAAVVVIALLGNPFSPGYARARATGDGRALDFCSLNVGLYSDRASAWTLDERSLAPDALQATSVTFGRSTMRWDSGALVIDVAERTALGRAVRGRVVLRPLATTGRALALDGRGEHVWWPAAPLARIEADFTEPALRFTGSGYHDANAGTGPLERAFARWTWSRARAGGRAAITYDVVDRGGEERTVALAVEPSGELTALEGLTSSPLPSTAWRIARSARVEARHPARVVRELEDGPFYARSLVATRLLGQDVIAMHETLEAGRLARAWVQFLTRFRMRRTGERR